MGCSIAFPCLSGCLSLSVCMRGGHWRIETGERKTKAGDSGRVLYKQ